MALTPEDFARLDGGDQMIVLYAELLHLRSNVKSAGEIEGIALRDHERRLTVIETRLGLLGTLGLVTLGVSLAALLKAAGLV